MNELGTELDRDGYRLVVQRQDPAADTRPRLEQLDTQPGGHQVTRCTQSRHSGADNGDIDQPRYCPSGTTRHSQRQ